MARITLKVEGDNRRIDIELSAAEFLELAFDAEIRGLTIKEYMRQLIINRKSDGHPLADKTDR
jgi:hypothetical protein